MNALSPKQKRFVEEYIKDGNITQAAIRAGYSEKSAHSQGSRLLKKAKTQEYLKKCRAQAVEDLQNQFISDALTARKVLYKIMKDPEASHRDRITAAKDLLDRAGFLPIDRKEITGRNGEPLEIIFVDK